MKNNIIIIMLFFSFVLLANDFKVFSNKAHQYAKKYSYQKLDLQVFNYIITNNKLKPQNQFQKKQWINVFCFKNFNKLNEDTQIEIVEYTHSCRDWINYFKYRIKQSNTNKFISVSHFMLDYDDFCLIQLQKCCNYLNLIDKDITHVIKRQLYLQLYRKYSIKFVQTQGEQQKKWTAFLEKLGNKLYGLGITNI